ncbi:MAG TPA: carboxypeptidase regulatory-like domain-containing protein [Gemmatimonadaceae bacterium]|nr:carboxypeptidase regulatory-like domain-containing protein [Gemmatimonadaceae bacterium]
MLRSLSAAVVLAVAVLSGCSGEKKASAAQPSAAEKEGSVPPRPAIVSPSATPYRAVAVTGGGALSGTVEFDGPIPPDSLVQPTAQQPGCGQTLTYRGVDRTGTRIGGVVVWLSDIRSGKQLPLERRFEIVNEDCVLNPRVQAVVAPGTLNFVSEDVAIHRHRIINVGTGELEGVAPFNDNGEVVPFDSLLDKPKQLEIMCEIHPWSKASVVAFDHPYFAVTARNGSFSVSDVPPGTYRLKAWHPVLGQFEQTVTVAGGQSIAVPIKLGSSTSPASPATVPPATPTDTGSASR